MKNILLFITLIMVCAGCSIKIIAVKSPYKASYSPHGKSFEQVWESVIDYFSDEGYPIQTIDKSSGIIVSYELSFANNWTEVNQAGEPINPQAYVAIDRVRWGLRNRPSIITLTGRFNIRVKTTNGNTIVKVQLIGLKAVGGWGEQPKHTFSITASSTGVLEKKITSLLTQ